MKIISVNIEGQRHLPLIEKFLTEEQADVVCLQEVFGVDLAQFQKGQTINRAFAPNTIINTPNRYGIALAGEWGVGMLVRAPWTVKSWKTQYYHGPADQIPEFVDGQPNSVNRALLVAELEHHGKTLRVATTHFTWTGDGNTSQEQLEDWASLQNELKEYSDFVLCGDFNAPRGREMGNIIEAVYASHVPADTQTTIDETFHYAGKLNLVVDYFLTQGNIAVQKVDVRNGISDHCALVAEVLL